MPIISTFYGIIIYMYFSDHMPPHFHAKYQGEEAQFLLSGDLLNGNMPERQKRQIKVWDDASNHRDLTAIRGLK